MIKSKPKRPTKTSCNSINYKCYRVECVFCSQTNFGVYCGHKERVVSPKEIKDCTDYKDRFN